MLTYFFVFKNFFFCKKKKYIITMHMTMFIIFMYSLIKRELQRVKNKNHVKITCFNLNFQT